MKNETQSALVARDAAIILLLIWAFMQALLMIWAPADTQTMYLLLLFLMDIAVLCGFNVASTPVRRLRRRLPAAGWRISCILFMPWAKRCT